MSGLSEQERACTCAHVDGYRIPSRSCPTHGPSMQPPRPAHEDPLRLTFTRDELDAAVAAAREEAAAKVEALAAAYVRAGDRETRRRSYAQGVAWRGAAQGLRDLAADIRKGDDRG